MTLEIQVILYILLIILGYKGNKLWLETVTEFDGLRESKIAVSRYVLQLLLILGQMLPNTEMRRYCKI